MATKQLEVDPTTGAPVEEPQEVTDVGDRTVVNTLLDVLGSSFNLYVRTLLAHWNVEGPGFFELHRAFGKMYERRQSSMDRVAERVRALGEVIDIPDDAKLSAGGVTNGAKLVLSLLDDTREAAQGVRDAYEAAAEANDIATAMLLEELALELEKDAWMLDAYVEGVRRK